MLKLRGLIFLILLVLPAMLFAQNEQLVITTYYPSPNGSYDEIGVNKLAVNVSGTQAAGAGTAPDPSNVVAVPSEYAAMRNGDAHIGWSMIIGAGNASGWAYDEMTAAAETMPGDGQLLVKDRVGIGNRLPQTRLDILDTTDPQLRLTNVVDTVDSTNDRLVDMQVDANGDLTVGMANSATGQGRIIFEPSGSGDFGSTRFFRIRNAYLSGGAFHQGSVFVVDNEGDSRRGRVGIGTGNFADEDLIPNRKLHVRKGGILINPTFGEHGIEIRELSPVNAGGGGWARNVKFSLDNDNALFDFGVLGVGDATFRYGFIGTGRFNGVANSAIVSYQEPSMIFLPNGEVGLGYTNLNYASITADLDLAVGLTALADAGAWGTRSSRAGKKDIAPLDGSLDKVMNLQGVSFKVKETDKKRLGLIAEDVEKIVPEAVIYGSKNETLGLDYNGFVPVLVEAIKEQQKEIDSLKKALEKTR